MSLRVSKLMFKTGFSFLISKLNAPLCVLELLFKSAVSFLTDTLLSQLLIFYFGPEYFVMHIQAFSF